MYVAFWGEKMGRPLTTKLLIELIVILYPLTLPSPLDFVSDIVMRLRP